jgi:hypothetical protein
MADGYVSRAMSMKAGFEFNRLDTALLITNAVALGGCVVLLTIGKGNGPLVLLTIGALGMLIGKLGRAYRRGGAGNAPLPEEPGKQ